MTKNRMTGMIGRTAVRGSEKKPSVNSYWLSSLPSLLGLSLMSVLSLSACQPKGEGETNSAQPATTETQTVGADEITPMSEAVKTHIESFETEFVNDMLNMQQSQLAEYEALQAADAPNDDTSLTPPASNSAAIKPDNATTLPDNGTNNSTASTAKVSELAQDPKSTTTASITSGSDSTVTASTNTDSTTPASTVTVSNKPDSKNSDLDLTNPALEATKLDSLQKLPLANIAIKPPEELSAAEISRRYNVALQSLYLADDMPVPAMAVDTLLSIATLTPDVFRNQDLAQRLMTKSPALARLLKQYQVWEQIQIQQSAELEAIKRIQLEEQQKQTVEFDALVEAFNIKNEGYDQQIKKYEKKLDKLK